MQRSRACNLFFMRCVKKQGYFFSTLLYLLFIRKRMYMKQFYEMCVRNRGNSSFKFSKETATKQEENIGGSFFYILF